MKLARWHRKDDDRVRLGVVAEDGIIDVTDVPVTAGGAGDPMDWLLADPRSRLPRLAERAAARAGRTVAAAEVVLDLPVARPRRNLFAVGRNYAAHVAEGARARGVAVELPTVPVFFTKAPSTLIADGRPIRVDPEVTAMVDYEGELAVVIGRAGRNITREQAPSHVFGYTVANDVSARDLQFDHVQWFKGKNLDTFCPLGPHIVTADEAGDLAARGLRTTVNGEVRQRESFANLLFDVPAVIESLSRGLTLRPGDVILTGTPHGVGFGMSPPRFLADGDVVRVEIDGIGALTNQITVVPAGSSAELQEASR